MELNFYQQIVQWNQSPSQVYLPGFHGEYSSSNPAKKTQLIPMTRVWENLYQSLPHNSP